MFKHAKMKDLADCFAPLSQRGDKIAYFCRITGYSSDADAFIRRYYRAALRCGVVIDSPLANPDPANLAYYHETMGDRFEHSRDFLTDSLHKWLPRIDSRCITELSESVFLTLDQLEKAGKNDHVLKNVYIKFMCWLYYRFERILNQLGGETMPKILIAGKNSAHGLLMLNALSLAGCDVLVLTVEGEKTYAEADPEGELSFPLPGTGGVPFPPDYSLDSIRKKVKEEDERLRLYEPLPTRRAGTNAWLSGDVFSDLLKEPGERGQETDTFYNCFCRLVGVQDKLTYQKDLYRLQLDLKKAKRKIQIISGRIDPPSYDEITRVRRSNQQSAEQAARELTKSICVPGDPELGRLAKKVFLDLFFEEVNSAPGPLSRSVGKAVNLLCWLRRYQETLFADLKYPQTACFIYLGGCKTENEALFCRFLARMPVDVLLLVPDLQSTCCLNDPLLYEVRSSNSLTLEKYPEDKNGLKLGTTAYNAERDLDTLMYGDTGLYRNQQFSKAKTIILQTMYEEISILWDQELKYRPNFDIVEDTVHLPVILAKVSGVKDAAVQSYWNSVRSLLTPETILIRSVPKITGETPNKFKASAASFLQNGRLLKDKVKSHRDYPFGHLREPIQEYMLEKLDDLLRSRLLKGRNGTGVEQTVVSTVLNLEKDVVRMIQKFDFTKKNPKLIYIVTGETTLSLEDAICVAYLNMLGFDILFFVPTGYQCVEQYFTQRIVEEHQIGEYLYDLQIPELTGPSARGKKTLHDILFNRRNE